MSDIIVSAKSPNYYLPDRANLFLGAFDIALHPDTPADELPALRATMGWTSNGHPDVRQQERCHPGPRNWRQVERRSFGDWIRAAIKHRVERDIDATT